MIIPVLLGLCSCNSQYNTLSNRRLEILTTDYLCWFGSGLFFELQGTRYLNNTLILVDEIGVGDSALLCRTNNDVCCSRASPFRGEFYYPDNTLIPTAGDNPSFYRNRDTNLIRLNRQPNTDIPLGEYRCEILDDQGIEQQLFIHIGKSNHHPCYICTLCVSNHMIILYNVQFRTVLDHVQQPHHLPASAYLPLVLLPALLVPTVPPLYHLQ